MRKRGWIGGLAVAAAVLLAAGPALGQEGEAEKLSFASEIRPILTDSCLACHGPDANAREAELRLDDRMAAIEAGAVVPGDPEASELVKRIFAEDSADRMPPPEHGHQLNDSQKALLKQWIAEGAEYEPHWSLQPVTRPDVPEVSDADWVRNPIDNFVLARLEREGLEPAPEADRRTLARRLSLDLTGLPPSPEQVEAFVNDTAPDAYERYVDELMSSVHWGEHRGRYWLDTARYADTHGLHFDNFREMWSYREWVIDAFNQNMPFDQFTIEQLAGDMLPEPSLDQLIATGFNRCNITTNEGGSIDEEVLVSYMLDRTETTATAWMGLTVGCAACHDHKFDPVTQKEFYQLAAFFNNTTQAAMDGNIPDTPPIVFVPMDEDRTRWNELPDEFAALGSQLEAHQPAARATFNEWLNEREIDEEAADAETVAADELHLQSPLIRGESAAFTIDIDGETTTLAAGENPQYTQGPIGMEVYSSQGGSVAQLPQRVGDFEKDEAVSFGTWVKLDGGNSGAIIGRMDEGDQHRGWDIWIEGGRVGTHVVHAWPDDALKVITKEPIESKKWVHVFITYDGSAKAGGVKVYVDGEKREVDIANDKLESTIRTDVPLKLAQRNNSARIDQLGLYDVRIYERELAADEIERLGSEGQVRQLLATPTEQLNGPQKDTLFAWWQTEHDAAGNEIREKIAALEQEKEAIRERGTIAHVMKERDEPAKAHVLFRGEYDQRREEVSPEVPAMLPPMPDDLPRNRLGFAKWLLMDEHPLTTRVTVNRFWQQVFGRAIVETPGDFGLSGKSPSHPELLDWLAVEFRENGWDVKDLFRTIVTSATYRQAAVVDERKLARDPDNVLLSRGPRFRMNAEMIRDYALASSGLLVRDVGGPSVRPYQPEGVWEAVAMPGSNTRFYERDSGDALYRRSLYTFWKRAAPPAFMDIFDATNREVCVVERDRTNTPLQALATLNDVQLVEAARHVAQRALLETGGQTDATIDHMTEHVMLRSPRSDEITILRRSIDDFKAFYSEHPAEAEKLVTHGESEPAEALEPTELAAWTMLANQLLNLDEVLVK